MNIHGLELHGNKLENLALLKACLFLFACPNYVSWLHNKYYASELSLSCFDLQTGMTSEAADIKGLFTSKGSVFKMIVLYFSNSRLAMLMLK